MGSAEGAALATRVVGCFPTWAGDVNAIPHDTLTHINYAFALPTAQGGLTGVSSGDARLRALVQAAHARGVKVLIAVGGWNDGNDSAFEQLAANAGARTNFVNTLVSFVSAAGLDGVDLDWEYPEPGASAQDFGAIAQVVQTSGGTAYRLVNKLTGRCVDIAGPSGADGTLLQQWAWSNNDCQQLRLEPL